MCKWSIGTSALTYHRPQTPQDQSRIKYLYYDEYLLAFQVSSFKKRPEILPSKLFFEPRSTISNRWMFAQQNLVHAAFYINGRVREKKNQKYLENKSEKGHCLMCVFFFY